MSATPPDNRDVSDTTPNPTTALPPVPPIVASEARRIAARTHVIPGGCTVGFYLAARAVPNFGPPAAEKPAADSPELG